MVAISHARGKNDMTQNEKFDDISYIFNSKLNDNLHSNRGSLASGVNIFHSTSESKNIQSSSAFLMQSGLFIVQ